PSPARATHPARRWLHPPTLDDDEAPQPRGRERAQQSRSHLLLILGGVAGALFLLVGGGLAYWLFRPSEPAKPVARNREGQPGSGKQDQQVRNDEGERLHAEDDLALVPADAVGFVSVRVADIWDSAVAKQMQEQLTQVMPGYTQQLEQNVGLLPAEVERAT